MYYKKYQRILDPFKIELKSSAKLQAIPRKRNVTSVALTLEEHYKIAKSFNECTPDGLQRKFYQVIAFEWGWKGYESASCLIGHFKEEVDANTADVECSRQEFFDALHTKLHFECSEKLAILEKCVSAKIKKKFIFHTDDKLAIQNLLTLMKIKWSKNNRTAEQFSNKNANWLKGTIKLKVGAAETAAVKSTEGSSCTEISCDLALFDLVEGNETSTELMDSSKVDSLRLHPTFAAHNAYHPPEFTMNLDTYQQMDETCRVCLVRLTTEKFTSIFSNNFPNIVSTLCNVEVAKDDELPWKICEICSSHLKQVMKLKAQIEASDNILRKRLYYMNNPVKEEINTESYEEAVYVKGEPSSSNSYEDSMDFNDDQLLNLDPNSLATNSHQSFASPSEDKINLKLNPQILPQQNTLKRTYTASTSIEEPPAKYQAMSCLKSSIDPLQIQPVSEESKSTEEISRTMQNDVQSVMDSSNTMLRMQLSMTDIKNVDTKEEPVIDDANDEFEYEPTSLITLKFEEEEQEVTGNINYDSIKEEDDDDDDIEAIDDDDDDIEVINDVQGSSDNTNLSANSKVRFGNALEADIDDLIDKSQNIIKPQKSMWNQFLFFCNERGYHLMHDITAEQMNIILKDWAVNMKKVNGDDYKEGVVKTMFNRVATIIKEMYYKEFKRVLDPLKDIEFKSSRDARDAKRKQLQAIPDKRKVSFVAFSLKDHQRMAKAFDENTPDGLQRKFYQIATFELAWKRGEAVACLVDYFKEHNDKFRYKSPITNKLGKVQGRVFAAKGKWLIPNTADKDVCPVRLLKILLSKRTERITTPRMFLTVNPNWNNDNSSGWFKNMPMGKNEISKWTKLAAEKVGIDCKKNSNYH